MQHRILLVLALLATLAACGWHPRGVQTLPPELAEIRLVVTPPDPRFSARLERSLKLAGVQVVTRFCKQNFNKLPENGFGTASLYAMNVVVTAPEGIK